MKLRVSFSMFMLVGIEIFHHYYNHMESIVGQGFVNIFISKILRA